MAGPETPEFSYRARRQRPVVDPAMRRIALGAGGIAILVIGVALVWSGVRPRGFGPPPEIAPPATALRVAPADPGGLTVPGANEAIMSGEESATPPSLAPSAPAPAIMQLQAQSGVPVLNAPAPPAAPPPAVPPPAVPGAPAAAGNVEVQLAATVDRAAAEKKWSAFQVSMAALAADRKPEFLPAVVDGQSIWRLRLGGFADKNAAAAFCAQVVAKGGACTVPAS